MNIECKTKGNYNQQTYKGTEDAIDDLIEPGIFTQFVKEWNYRHQYQKRGRENTDGCKNTS